MENRQTIEDLPGKLYSSAQVRELDQRVITAGTPGWVLMQRAARATFEAMVNRWPQALSVCVVCGKGNNGGDGFLVARIARDKGYSVNVIEVGLPDYAAPLADQPQSDAERARGALLATDVHPVSWDKQQSAEALIESADIVVDALLGTGLKGGLRSPFDSVIAGLNQRAKKVVSVDIPSGICSDTGHKLGEQAVEADLTVTFIGLKKGLFTADAPDHIGDLVFDSLEVAQAIVDTQAADAELLQAVQLLKVVPRRKPGAFKNQSGHLLVIGGDTGMGGAPLLAAEAGLRCGAGLVSVATHRDNASAITSRQPALMARGLEKTVDVTALLRRATTVVIGPGLGTGAWGQQLLVHTLMYLKDNPVSGLLLDADALNLLASRPAILKLFNDVQQKQPDCSVITPHPGEAVRLLQEMSPGKGADRFAMARALQQKYQSTIVLKGAGTLLQFHDHTGVCPYGNPVLATAGSGDVLSGVIGGLMAQGLSPEAAAKLAVSVHGLAADAYLQSAGPVGLTATHLADFIVQQLNRLHAQASVDGCG